MALEASGGGVGRHVIDLCQGLSQRGHRIVLAYSPLRAEQLFLSQLAALDTEAVPVEMKRAIGPWDLGAARDLAHVAKTRGPFHIVHGHSSKAGALVRCIPTGPAKVVYTPHAFRGLDPESSKASRSAFTMIEAVLGARTDALIAVSQSELDFAYEHRIARARQHLVHNGIFSQPLADRAEVRQEVGFSAEDVIVGFVGRLTHQKAPERFVTAMTKAFAQDERLRALIIGDGDLRDAVLKQVADSGYEERFCVLRGVDAKRYFAAMDMLMITSRYEGFSYVMIEAMTAGVPLISTPVGGIGEAIGEENCGVIVTGFDSTSELAETVTAIASRPALLDEMKARASIRGAHFNGAKMVAETEAIYQRILGSEQAAA